jgi:hypothetical protein
MRSHTCRTSNRRRGWGADWTGSSETLWSGRSRRSIRAAEWLPDLHKEVKATVAMLRNAHRERVAATCNPTRVMAFRDSGCRPQHRYAAHGQLQNILAHLVKGLVQFINPAPRCAAQAQVTQ